MDLLLICKVISVPNFEFLVDKFKKAIAFSIITTLIGRTSKTLSNNNKKLY